MRALKRIRPSYANVVTALALVLTLGGVSYAAIALPAKSVGKKQLAKNAVVGSKVKNGSLLAADVKGKLPAGPAGKPGDQGPAGIAGAQGAPSSATRTVMSGTVALAGANEFFAPSGVSVASADEADVTMLSPNRAMIARNLSVRLANPPGVGIVRRIDLRINNLITTDLECTITHPATTCTSTGSVKDELVIPANTRISVSNVSSGGAAAATQAQFGFTLERSP